MADGVKYCRQCGKQLNIDAKFCRYCGYQFDVAQEVKAVTNLCPQCGKDNAAGAKFCRHCGAGLTGAKATTTVRHGKSNTTKPATTPQIPELKMSATSEPGEFDYGDIDLKSIAGRTVGKAASAAMAKSPGLEILSPAKTLGNSIGGFLKGIVNLIRDPKSAIVPLLFAALWIVLAFLRDSDLLPVRVLSWLTFAEGGLDRGPVGMLGGILGKGVVAAAFASLFHGGFGSCLRGLKALVTGNGEKRGIGGILLGLAAGVLLYIAFTGIKTASAATTMAGIAGAVLSLEALGNSDGFLVRMAQALTPGVRNGMTEIQYNKAAGLLTGMVIGFLLGAVLMVFV